jgi:hypothetical protein
MWPGEAELIMALGFHIIILHPTLPGISAILSSLLDVEVLKMTHLIY